MQAATPEAEAFEQFARQARGSSPLYEYLARRVATEDRLLALAAEVRPRHLQPNLLFAAAHYLLIKGRGPDLARFYPSIVGVSALDTDAYPKFREFCLAEADAIRNIISSRRVQTNEVRRCASLVPAFAAASDALDTDRAAFIEIGASAGLNLQWNRYYCDYGEKLTWGEPKSPVRFACELRGWGRPSVSELPAIVERYGIDIAPINVRNPDDVLWLNALVWPEHAERRDLLQGAVEITKSDPPKLIAGDAASILPLIVDGIAADLPLIVFHSFTMNQLGSEQRMALEDALCALGARRPLARIGFEWPVGAEQPNVMLSIYASDRIERCVLAECEPHCAWMRWAGG